MDAARTAEPDGPPQAEGPPRGAGLNRPGVVAALLGLALFGLYLSTLTSDHTYDGVVFAMLAESAVGSGFGALELYHPHHVLYNGAVALLLKAAFAVGLPLGGMALLQVVSAVGGAVTAALAYLRLHEWTKSEFLAAGGALALALAAGPWFFSTDSECDMPALALMLAALGPALRFLERGGRWTGVGAALLLALAVAFHLTLGLAWIGLLVAGLAAGRASTRRVVTLLLGASVLLALAYVPRAVILVERPGPFDPVRLIAFTGESFGGGYLLQEGFHPRAELAETLRGFTAGGPGACGPLATALHVVPLAWLVAGVAALALRRGGTSVRATGAWFFGAWILFSFWAGRNFEFTPFQLAPLALFGTAALAAILPSDRLRDRLGLALLLAAVAAGALNWACFIRPKQDPKSNPLLRQMQVIRETTKPGDRVIVTGAPDSRLKVYVIYFGQRQPIIPDFVFGPRITTEESLRRFEARLERACAEGGTLHAMPALVEEGATAPWPIEAVRTRLRELHPVPVATDENGVVLYRLDCP